MRGPMAGALATLLILAACGGGPSLSPMLASSPAGIGVGDQRVLIALIDIDTNQMAATPDAEVVATLRDRNGSPLGEYPGEFVWILPDVRGLYAFDLDIPGPGTYQVTLAGSLGSLGPMGLVAMADPPVVGVGDPAPLSVTRTTSDHALGDITSDPDPDPRFYRMTVAEAVEDGPSVIVFATPAWCVSQACGPLLDQVKAMADVYPGLNFVHVEVYEDIHVTSFEELEYVPSVLEWGLVAEPWVFVTDSSGLVAGSFEGAVSDGELRRAFDRVTR
jgi:hypothetical protein